MRFRFQSNGLADHEGHGFGLCLADCLVVVVRRSPRCNISWAYVEHNISSLMLSWSLC